MGRPNRTYQYGWKAKNSSQQWLLEKCLDAKFSLEEVMEQLDAMEDAD